MERIINDYTAYEMGLKQEDQAFERLLKEEREQAELKRKKQEEEDYARKVVDAILKEHGMEPSATANDCLSAEEPEAEAVKVKYCLCCKKALPVDEFPKLRRKLVNGTYTYYSHTYCKRCCVQKSKESRERARVKAKTIIYKSKRMEKDLKEKKMAKTKAADAQVGGDHYQSMAIQPLEYITANGLGYCEGNVVKYVSRWRKKGGIEDLEKAKHYIDLLIEAEQEAARP